MLCTPDDIMHRVNLGFGLGLKDFAQRISRFCVFREGHFTHNHAEMLDRATCLVYFRELLRTLVSGFWYPAVTTAAIY